MGKRSDIERLVMEKGKVVEFFARKYVKKIGTGCHVTLPRELLNKRVNVIFKEESDGKKDRHEGKGFSKGA